VESELSFLAIADMSSGSSMQPASQVDISQACAKHVRFPHLCYACWGITLLNESPSAWLCRCMMNLTVACCASFVIWDLVQAPDRLYENFAEAASATALLVSLISFWGLDDCIGQCNSLVLHHAHQHGFIDPQLCRVSC